MSGKDYTSEGGIKKLMKLRKEDICKMYIEHLNKSKFIDPQSDTPQLNETEETFHLNPSFSQAAICKSIPDFECETSVKSDHNLHEVKGHDVSVKSDDDDDSLFSMGSKKNKDPEDAYYRKETTENADEIKELEHFIDSMGFKARYKDNGETNLHLMYERIILIMKSEIKSLRKLIDNDNSSLRDEINFLRDRIIVKDALIEGFLNDGVKSVKLEQNAIIKPLKSPLNISDHAAIKNDQTDIYNIHDDIINLNNTRAVNELNNRTKSNKSYIELIGDSHLNNVAENGLRSETREVKIKRWSGGNTEDMLDIIKPIIRKKPDEIIIHVGCNDLSKNVNPLTNIKKICKTVKHDAPNTKLTFSSILIRKDKKDITENMIQEVNSRLKNYCKENDLGFINNENIGASWLGKGKLHMNAKGTSLLAKNFLNHMNPV